MQSNHYIDIVCKTIDRAWNSQRDVCDKVSDAIRKALTDKHSVFVFGCSHAGILAEEVFYRTGGLAILNPIFFPGFMLNTRPITMTSKLERLEGLGKILLEENHVKSGDLLIIHSVSGRNTVPVEMAIEAAKLGVTTVAITSIAYSSAVTSRHPSGKRLFEVCPLVIDNCGVAGDAAIKIDGLAEPIGPTSTTVGAALLNAVVIETVEKMVSEGEIPPVLMSANLDGGDEHNMAVFEKYGDCIFYL